MTTGNVGQICKGTVNPGKKKKDIHKSSKGHFILSPNSPKQPLNFSDVFSSL
jgi:hypothetical protein